MYIPARLRVYTIVITCEIVETVDLELVEFCLLSVARQLGRPGGSSLRVEVDQSQLVFADGRRVDVVPVLGVTLLLVRLRQSYAVRPTISNKFPLRFSPTRRLVTAPVFASSWLLMKRQTLDRDVNIENENACI